MRVVLDSHLRLPPASQLLGGAEVLILTASADRKRAAALAERGAQIVVLNCADGGLDLAEVLDELGRRELNEVQVEAGPTLAGNLLRQGLVDELVLYLAPRLLGSNARAMFTLPFDAMVQSLDLHILDQRMVGDDMRLVLAKSA